MKLKLLFFCILSGLFFFFSWPPMPLFYLLFIAFIPLIYIHEEILQKKIRKINYLSIYLAFLIWNTSSTYWILKMNLIGGISTFIANSFLQLLPFLFSYITVYLTKKKYLGELSLILSWISFEIIFEKWDLAWPLLTLGNGLGDNVLIIQWYEFIGVHGGSLWIILINLLLYKVFLHIQRKLKLSFIHILSLIAVLIVPLICSLFRYYNYRSTTSSAEIVVVHPNLNCYSEKYNGSLSVSEQVSHHIKLTKECITQETNYIIWPETAIPNLDWIELLDSNQNIQNIKNFLKDFPNAKLVTGAVIFELFKEGLKTPANNEKFDLHFHTEFKVWYYTYNAALFVDTSDNIQIHAKQNLVPFEERVPYPKLLSIFKNAVGSLGNFGFSRRSQNQYIFDTDSNKIVPLICYESLFSDEASKYTRQGGNALFVILNEGWYNSSFGALQFFSISRIRAIENRRFIVRSSNYGISSIIDYKGDIIKKDVLKLPNSFKSNIQFNKNISFYAKYSGNINLVILIAFFLLVFFTFISYLLTKFMSNENKSNPD